MAINNIHALNIEHGLENVCGNCASFCNKCAIHWK